MSKRYIVDFDYTLLDTHLFKDDLAAVFSLKGCELSMKWKEAGGEDHYNPWQHARLLGNGNTYDAAIDAVCTKTKQYLFPNVVDWLAQLDGVAQLLTRGDISLQQAKVNGSGLKSFFQTISFTEGNKVVALASTQQDDQWILVNDNAKELKDLSQNYPQAEVICLHGPYSSKDDLPWPVYDPKEFFSSSIQSI